MLLTALAQFLVKGGGLELVSFLVGVSHPVEAALLDPVDRAARHKGALVVTRGHLAIRADANSVRSAEATGVLAELGAVLADLENAAVVLTDTLKATPPTLHRHTEGEVEIPRLVSQQVKGKGVEAAGQLPVVVEVLVVVGLTITIEVMVARDLVVTHGVDLFIDNPQTEGLMNTTGKKLPLQVAKPSIDVFHNPYVAIPGANRRTAATSEEVEGGHPQGTRVGIFVRKAETIHHIGRTLILSGISLRGDDIGPLGGTSLTEFCEGSGAGLKPGEVSAFRVEDLRAGDGITGGNA